MHSFSPLTCCSFMTTEAGTEQEDRTQVLCQTVLQMHAGSRWGTGLHTQTPARSQQSGQGRRQEPPAKWRGQSSVVSKGEERHQWGFPGRACRQECPEIWGASHPTWNSSAALRNGAVGDKGRAVCWNLPPNVMVFGSGALGKWLLEHEWDQCSYKTDPRELPPLSTMWRHGEKIATVEPGGGSSPDTKCANLDLGLSSL